ncbi:MAG: RIP metalloprotease RseP [Gammaproteobacteria bacterium]
MDILNLIQTVLFALLAIGILVTVHEYGHYIVARKLGIKVLKFSIGFGKPIVNRTAGVDNTEYIVGRWPLGGYVKMLDSRDCEVSPEERHRAFNHQPILNRILVLLAGPAFNFILAIFFLWLVFMLGVSGLKPVVGEVREGSPAAMAGLAEEDQIVRVNGDEVNNWNDAHMALLDGVIAGPEIEMGVRHKDSQRERTIRLGDLGDRKALTEPEALMSGLGFSIWWPRSIARIETVHPDTPAQRAGLMTGDIVLAVNGVSTPYDTDATREIRRYPEESVSLTVLRDDREQEMTAQLASVVQDGRAVGQIGVMFEISDDAREQFEGIRFTEQLGVVPAFSKAVSETGNLSVMMVSMLYKMVIGQVSIKNISGPLNIARFAGQTARQGPTYYIRFLALLSLSLGVLNLLPVPMLDGGQVVYQIAESIKGSPLSMRAEIIGQQIGMAMLVVLMFFAFRNDLVSIFG